MYLLNSFGLLLAKTIAECNLKSLHNAYKIQLSQFYFMFVCLFQLIFVLFSKLHYSDTVDSCDTTRTSLQKPGWCGIKPARLLIRSWPAVVLPVDRCWVALKASRDLHANLSLTSPNSLLPRVTRPAPRVPMVHADTTVPDDQYRTHSTALTLWLSAPFTHSESETGP